VTYEIKPSSFAEKASPEPDAPRQLSNLEAMCNKHAGQNNRLEDIAQSLARFTYDMTGSLPDTCGGLVEPPNAVSESSVSADAYCFMAGYSQRLDCQTGFISQIESLVEHLKGEMA
jgi:hypothetical protein